MLVFVSSLALLALSMCFTPGPTNALAVATGLERGFRAALPLALGSAVGANLTLLALGFGLAEVFARFPIVYDGLRIVGAGYLVWLAWRISGLRLPERVIAFVPGLDKRRMKQEAQRVLFLEEQRETTRKSGFQPLTFFQAAALSLVNVKIWLTNIIIMSSYVGAGEDWRLRLYVAFAIFLVMGASAQCVWAALGVFMRRFLTADGVRKANYCFAVFLLISIGLLFA